MSHSTESVPMLTNIVLHCAELNPAFVFIGMCPVNKSMSKVLNILFKTYVCMQGAQFES